jgi:hypothetical protein
MRKILALLTAAAITVAITACENMVWQDYPCDIIICDNYTGSYGPRGHSKNGGVIRCDDCMDLGDQAGRSIHD